MSIKEKSIMDRTKTKVFTNTDASLMERRMSHLDQAARDIRMQAAEFWGDRRRKEIARAAAMQREVAIIRDWLRAINNTEGQ
jgi:hypothetical protein